MSKEIRIFLTLHIIYIVFAILTTSGLYIFHPNNGLFIWLSYFWIICPIGIISFVLSLLHAVITFAGKVNYNLKEAIFHFIFFAISSATFIICGELFVTITCGA